MDTEVDLTTVDRAVLIAIIAELQAVIERLQRRIAELEGQAKPGDPPRMPGLKAKSARKPPAQQQPRKQRRHGFARPRMTPTHRVEHVMENCPDCGAHLSGGWTQRTREVIELPVVPVQVTEHVYLARTCPACRRRCTPPAVLDGVVLGQQRLGVNLLSLIATLREEGRLPIRSVQWYLDTVHQLRLSVGAIVSAIHQTAQRAQPAVAAILDRIRASPVVHADETGWRQSGANGYVWTFSTPTERYFLRRGRGKAVVDEALGESFSGNCSDLRGSEQLAAGGEGVQASCAPGAEDGCQRHLALGTTFRPGAPADLAADNQMAPAALGGVVVRRHVRFGHEDEEFLDVALDAPAQPALQS